MRSQFHGFDTFQPDSRIINQVMAKIVMALGNDHMALSTRLNTLAGTAILALIVPFSASANEPKNDLIEATHFVSSGRIVNLVADVTPSAQADARAQIWALTGRVAAPDCVETDASDAPCFATFQTGAK